MKLRKLLPILFCAFSLSGCNLLKNNNEHIDNRDEKILAVYAAYQENGGTLVMRRGRFLQCIQGKILAVLLPEK